LWQPEEAAERLAPFCAAAGILFCGRADARTLWGLDGDDEAVLRALAGRFGAAVTVLTLGEQGALALTRDGQLLRQPGVPVAVVDRVGAGDAFAAGFLHGYLDGDLPAALRLGVSLAALKMTIHGDLSLINGQELAAWSDPHGRGIIR
ncbi:MAG TPA: PfkB family carbohydrate kinase, partial [Dyella sp.]|nr:PfkB family carbohydrate kinase [Dyella sp.]